MASASCELSFESVLAAPATSVWNAVATLDGVNAELAPWLHMTHPEVGDIPIDEAPVGQTLFASWVLLRGLPIDRHFFKLEAVTPGGGFREHSSSWLESSWVHERAVVPHGDGQCTVTDHLVFSPRLRLLAPVIQRIVKLAFTHRHAQLRQRFGQPS